MTKLEVRKLKNCSLYQDNLLLQKINDMIIHVLKNVFSASDIMEAVRGCFRFYGNQCYLTTFPVKSNIMTEFKVLKLKTCSFYQDKLLLQKINDRIIHVLKYNFSASDIMEAVRGCFLFYGN